MINGERGWLWRAVDDVGEVLDILVQRRRSALAATRFFRKLLKGLRRHCQVEQIAVDSDPMRCGNVRPKTLRNGFAFRAHARNSTMPENAHANGSDRRRSPPREESALLQGLAVAAAGIG